VGAAAELDGAEPGHGALEPVWEWVLSVDRPDDHGVRSVLDRELELCVGGGGGVHLGSADDDDPDHGGAGELLHRNPGGPDEHDAGNQRGEQLQEHADPGGGADSGSGDFGAGDADGDADGGGTGRVGAAAELDGAEPGHGALERVWEWVLSVDRPDDHGVRSVLDRELEHGVSGGGGVRLGPADDDDPEHGGAGELLHRNPGGPDEHDAGSQRREQLQEHSAHSGGTGTNTGQGVDLRDPGGLDGDL